jgi:hypothetical protein
MRPDEMFDLWLRHHDGTGRYRADRARLLEAWRRRSEVQRLTTYSDRVIRTAITAAPALTEILEQARQLARAEAATKGRRKPQGVGKGKKKPPRSLLTNDIGHWSDHRSGLTRSGPPPEHAAPDRCSNCGGLIPPGAAHDC